MLKKPLPQKIRLSFQTPTRDQFKIDVTIRTVAVGQLFQKRLAGPQKIQTPSCRSFLRSVGKLGGAGAMYETMAAMGLLQMPAPWAGTKQVSAGTGQGESVLILGADIAGMTAAYEMGKAGCRCTFVETLVRAGVQISPPGAAPKWSKTRNLTLKLCRPALLTKIST